MTRPQAEPPRPGDDYAIPPRPTEVIAARAAHQALRREIVAAGGGSIAASLLPVETGADDPAEASVRAMQHAGAVAVPGSGGCEAAGGCRCQGAASQPQPQLLVDRMGFAMRLRGLAMDLQDQDQALNRLANGLIRQDGLGAWAPIDGAEVAKVLEYRIGEARKAIEGLEELRAEVGGQQVEQQGPNRKDG